jgi:hypothetical protein
MNEDGLLDLLLRMLNTRTEEDQETLDEVNAMVPALFEARLARKRRANPTLYPNPERLIMTGDATSGVGTGLTFRPWIMDDMTPVQRENMMALWEDVFNDVQDFRNADLERAHLEERADLHADMKEFASALVSPERLPIMRAVRGGQDMLREGGDALRGLATRLQGEASSLQNFLQDFLIGDTNFVGNKNTPRAVEAERFAGR